MTELTVRREQVDMLGQKGELIQQIEEAILGVATADGEDASETLLKASVTEAAAKQCKASEVELAAARLRLHAERRIGELAISHDLSEVVHQYKGKELVDFKRLARIPRVWRNKPLETLTGKQENQDLFLHSLDHQLQARLSHTAYSVYLASIDLSGRRHPKYKWLSSGWDGTWIFHYTDARTKNVRSRRFVGTIEEVLELRAELSGRVSASSTKLLPVRGVDTLSSVLDHLRYARDTLDGCWEELNEQQKRELDGVYGRMDDMARALLVSVNL